MHFSVLGHERLTTRYLTSNAAHELKKFKFHLEFHAYDTGFYWSFENALHKQFIASDGVEYEWKTLQFTASVERKYVCH